MTPEEKEAFYSEVYAKAFAMCGDQAEAERRAKAAVEVREWRENHDRLMASLEDDQQHNDAES
jgi:hypothetical protein